MKAMITLRIVASAVLLGLAVSSGSYSQTANDVVPGALQVKFAPQELTEIPLALRLDHVKSQEIRSFLVASGFRGGMKIFKGAMPEDTVAVARSGEVVQLKDLSRWYVLQMDQGADVRALADTLREMRGIESAVPARIFYPTQTFPNDTYFGLQWGLYNSGNRADIHAPEAWDINRGRSDVVVAVVDGGVDYNHEDLDPGDRSRVIQGRDTGDDDDDPIDDLPEGDNRWGNHGSRVAGVIGAMTDNDRGVAGILWNGQIMPVKVANSSGWGLLDGVPEAPSNGTSLRG